MVLGVAIPLRPNSAPVRLTTDTVKSLAPVFEIERVLVPDAPTPTVPKFTAAELNEICGSVVIPVAERFNTTAVLLGSPWIVSVPLRFPVAAGFTQTEKVPVWPACSAIGVVIPDRANCGLESVACWIVVAVLLVFRIVMLCDVFLPTATFPKLTFAGLS